MGAWFFLTLSPSAFSEEQLRSWVGELPEHWRRVALCTSDHASQAIQLHIWRAWSWALCCTAELCTTDNDAGQFHAMRHAGCLLCPCSAGRYFPAVYRPRPARALATEKSTDGVGRSAGRALAASSPCSRGQACYGADGAGSRRVRAPACTADGPCCL